jgi:hypothetical protein
VVVQLSGRVSSSRRSLVVAMAATSLALRTTCGVASS